MEALTARLIEFAKRILSGRWKRKMEGAEKPRLHTAAAAGETSVVNSLLAEGVNVNLKHKHDTALDCAASRGHLSVVHLLLDAGADVAGQDDECLALIYACRHGHLSVVEALLRHGAKVNVVGRLTCHTPLFGAAGGQFHRVARDPQQRNLVDAEQAKIVKVLLDHGAEVDRGDIDGNTPLHSACDNGYIATAELLLAAGADINAKQADGQTPLNRAAPHYDMVLFLNKRGAVRS